MNRKRLALAAAAPALLMGVVAVPHDAMGQTQNAPGLTYGGMKDTYSAWLRLAPGRTAIASLQMDWAVAPKRCSNQRAYSSTLYAGFEELHPVDVSEAGTFRSTVVDRFANAGNRYEEHQTISGTITGDVATGSLSGRVKITQRSGRIVRCTFGPQRWRLVD